MESVVKGLAKNTALKELDVSKCGCDDKAGPHLAAVRRAGWLSGTSLAVAWWLVGAWAW